MSACYMPSAVLDVPHNLSCFILNGGPLSVKNSLWKAPPPSRKRKEVWAEMVDALSPLWSQSVVGK